MAVEGGKEWQDTPPTIARNNDTIAPKQWAGLLHKRVRMNEPNNERHPPKQ